MPPSATSLTRSDSSQGHNINLSSSPSPQGIFVKKHHANPADDELKTNPQEVKRLKKTLLDHAALAPPSQWIHKSHPLTSRISREVDGYFLKHWNFPSPKYEQKFLDADFSGVTCLYFPLARDDRIGMACKLLTVLFIIDDILDHMSFEDGEAYNNQLMPIMAGNVQPNSARPVEYIMYDLWNDMREHNVELANATLESTYTFMRAQTEKSRGTMSNLGSYLLYRERDVGKALLSNLMAFTMDLHLTSEEKALVRPHERNCAKQISVVKDICSYEKEVMAAREGHAEGGMLCSAVEILASEMDLGVRPTKRVLWAMAREWSVRHDTLLDRLRTISGGVSDVVESYLKGLEYQMSGNEEWSLTTMRYLHVPGWVDDED